jgi:hypothetical protein
VNALADVYSDVIVTLISVFFLRERLDVPLALRVGVIDDPGFLELAGSGRPSALAN